MQKTKNTTAAAGLAGAIIGAGLTAAAVALSDKDTRKKVTASIIDVKKRAEKVMQDVSKKTNDPSTHAKKALDEGKKTIEDMPPKTEHPMTP